MGTLPKKEESKIIVRDEIGKAHHGKNGAQINWCTTGVCWESKYAAWNVRSTLA
jgi:hypothetical protein